MTMLRTVIRIWVVFLIGVTTTTAYLALTPPLATRIADVAVGLAVFGGGLAAGLALDRYVHAERVATPVAEVDEQSTELVKAA